MPLILPEEIPEKSRKMIEGIFNNSDNIEIYEEIQKKEKIMEQRKDEINEMFPGVINSVNANEILALFDERK